MEEIEREERKGYRSGCNQTGERKEKGRRRKRERGKKEKKKGILLPRPWPGTRPN